MESLFFLANIIIVIVFCFKAIKIDELEENNQENNKDA